MIDQQSFDYLFNYIKQQLEQGWDRGTIKEELLRVGWQEADIDEVFSNIFGSVWLPEKSSSEESFRQSQTLPGIDSLLTRTISIFKEILGTLLGIYILIVFISLPFGFLSIVISERLGIPFVFLFTIWIIIIHSWINVSLLIGLMQVAEKDKEKIEIQDILSKGLSKIFSFTWIIILLLLVTVGGLLLGVIPGVIFYIYFMFAPFILITENIGGMNALFRSKQLVSGLWKEIFIRRLPILLILGVITFVSLFFFGTNILSIFITLFILIYDFVLYNDLKNFKGDIPLELPSKRTKKRYMLIITLGFLLILIFSVREKIYPYLPGYVPQTKSTAEDLLIKTSFMQMQLDVERVYISENTYAYIDCAHPSISSACSTFKKFFGKNPVIHTSPDAYCVYMDIMLTTGEYYCIDYQGIRRATTNFPGQAGFCDGITFTCP